ncbi:MAG: TonB-dependent receptor [Tannerellaceae bacterium]|jgi:TonB-linked SusC/RagA family outer membrane protein|nr:TonB-dependent receptor [Tannerellaceae bacterium]
MKNKQKINQSVRNPFYGKEMPVAPLRALVLMLILTATSLITHASVTVQQQSGRTVSGTVVDEAGEALIGVNVVITGTTTGAITDFEGRFSLQAPAGNVSIQVSYVGYLTQTIAVTGNQPLRITLREDQQQIDEVVVVGYGTQAKKDITGSVSVVSADALQETPVATFAEALLGKAAGVYVSASGTPGAETTIRVRGVGSVNSSDPLIVVDGVSGVEVNSVNPNDIESFQILKDASATAIYGAQGANGVIIVTTKKGTKDRVRVSYNGYTGAATMANSGFNLLNAWEAMEFVAAGMINQRDVRHMTPASHAQFGTLNANDELTMPYAIHPTGQSEAQIIQQFGSIEAWEKSYRSNGSNSWSRSAYYQMLKDGYSEEEARAGTDWYKLATRTGSVQDHQISAMGGNERGQYSISLGYNSIEGTIKGSYFDRYSLRINSAFSPNKWLNIGANVNLSAMETSGERGSQGDASVFGKTYTTQPWLPVYNVGGEYAGSVASAGGRDVSSVALIANQENDWNRNFRGQASLFAEIKPIEGLTVRTQFSPQLGGRWERTFNEVTIMTNREGASTNSLYELAEYNLDWQWTNTATYARTFNQNHQMTVIVGSEALSNGLGRRITATRQSYSFPGDINSWMIDNGSTANVSNSGYMHNNTTMFGFFGRGDYVYKNKYMGTVTLRYDGSSKFGANNRYGTFPALSLGWRITEEAFMATTRGWLDDLKIRAGYGTTGNSNIGAYNYAFQFATGNSYNYGMTGTDTYVGTGYAISNLGDPDAKWETVRSLDIGLDGSVFNKLTFNLDWYMKKTTDMLVPANWSALAGGATKPSVNIGDIENYGVELNLVWRDKIGALRYNIGANISTYRNTVTRLGSSDLFTSTRLNNVTITTEGQPISMFYGYNVLGIYQNADEVTGYKTADGKTILPFGVGSLEALNPDAIIGRYKVEDVTGDGKIDGDDRTIIGNPHPDFTGGLNIGLNWKQWDFSTYFVFSVGNDIFRQYMLYTHFGSLQSNYSKDRRDNSWSPSNPNGIYPLWTSATLETAQEAASESHSGYVQDGSYLRNQTLTIGYSFSRKILSRIGLERLRVYGQVGNLFTVTGYDGLDPEIRSYESYTNGVLTTSRDRTKGIDFGGYGMPRQFLVGLNVSF